MSASYQVVTIGDVCSVGDGAHSKVKRQVDGILYLTSKNIGSGNLKLDKIDFISEEDFEKLFPLNTKATRRPQAGDVLMGIIGTFGNAYLYKKTDHFGFSSAVAVLRPNKEYLFPKFLYYVVTSKSFKFSHLSHNGGSVQGYTNIPTIKKLPIPLPSIIEQKIIADILASFDDKIQLNRQINQTLEEMAQAIFKSWFVDFEPVKAKIEAKVGGQDPERAAMCAISGKTDAELDQLPPDQLTQLRTTASLFPDQLTDSELGPIPNGWEWKKLVKILDLNPKRTLKKGSVALYLDMKNMPTQGHLAGDLILREMGSGTKFINGDTLLARITPCLENGKTAFVDFLCDGEVGWGSTEYIVMRAKEPFPLWYSYLLARDKNFRSFAIQNMTGTSGRQRVNTKSLENYLVPIAKNEKIYSSFSFLVKNMMAQIKCNGDQNKILAQLRDTLLPKLLSGEISLGEAQTTIKETV